MRFLFRSNLFSDRFTQSLGAPSPSVSPAKKAEQKENSPAVRGNALIFFGFLSDFALFCLILTIDAILTAKILFRPLRTQKKILQQDNR